MVNNILAGGENRTPTSLPRLDFESSASTSSATPALYFFKQKKINLLSEFIINYSYKYFNSDV